MAVFRIEVLLRKQSLLGVHAVLGVQAILGSVAVLRKKMLLGAQTLGGQELLVREDPASVRRHAIRRHAVVLLRSPLRGQDAILGHGPLDSTGPLPLGLRLRGLRLGRGLGLWGLALVWLLLSVLLCKKK